ncbi:MAG: hypothetical protein GXC73_15980, partial [Chitinophagaceae bacterium]|nr:hypothetical protein [Chitinophagaceae bacterium]
MNHITTIRRFVNKNGYLLILAGWLLTFSYLFQYYWSYTSAPVQVKKALQKNINRREKDFAKILKDTSLLLRLNQGKSSKDDVAALVGRDYFIFVASDGSDGFQTRFWNTQTILPANELWQRADGIWFEQLINGYYTVYKQTVKLGNKSSCYAMALIPVKWNYFVTTNYLSNTFAYVDGIEKYYSISDLEQSSLQIKATDGTGLFWLKEQNNFPQPLNKMTVLLRFMAMFCFLMLLHKAAAAMVARYSFSIGLLFLVVAILLLRILSYYFPIPLNLRQFDLFDPAVYGSNSILRSLGDLLINSFLLLWILLFIRRYGKTAVIVPFPFNRKVGLIITTVLIFGLTILFGNIVRSLIADSQISFDVTNIFSLNIFSFAGFFILGSLALNYFLLVDWLFGFLKRYSENKLQIQILMITIAGLLYLTFTLSSSLVLYHLALLGWLLMLTVLFSSRRMQLSFLPSTGKTIFWLFFFSVSLTSLLISENGRKQWLKLTSMAEKLSLQTDPSAESLLNIALRNFRSDFLDEQFYRFANQGSSQFLKDSLVSESFTGYLNKFDTEIYAFNELEQPLYNIDSTAYSTLNTIYNLQSRPTSVRDWQYYEESFDRFYYIARKEVVDRETGRLTGFIFLVSRPKRYSDEKFYPELFSKSFNLLPDNAPAYAYAIYKNKELITSANDYPFPIHLTQEQENKSTYTRIKKNGYLELWYSASKSLTVVVTKPQNNLLESITLFAWLFCVFLLMLTIFRMVQYLLRLGVNRSQWKQHLQLTFRTQVHTTIIGISIFSFLIIGASTIFFFINRHSRINKERLSRTIGIMRSEVEAALNNHAIFDDVLKVYDDASSRELQNKVNRISEIHGVDVNIYDPEGNLRISSQPYYYNKGLLSRKSDPLAYYKLTREYLVQTVEDEK